MRTRLFLCIDQSEKTADSCLYLHGGAVVLQVTAMSLSSSIRSQGNEFFRRASLLEVGCTPQKAKDIFEKALSCYYRAKGNSQTRDEECSAAKNIGKAASKIAAILTRLDDKPEKVIFYLHEAIKGFCAAYNRSESVKTAGWRTEVFGTLTVCLQDVIDASDGLRETDSKIAALEKLILVTTVEEALADIQVKLAGLYFHDGATKLQKGDFRKCLIRMKDSYRPIEEAKRLSRVYFGEMNCDLLSEIHTLEQDVVYHTCSALSTKARMQGDELLKTALKDQEELDMNLIFEIIDWYKQAVIQAREVEIEQEAIAESRLGVVYDRVLKVVPRAKAYFIHSLNLAESLKPRVFTSHDWYKDCITALQKYQEEARLRDEEEEKQCRARFLEELKDELKDIEDNKANAVQLIKHVYANYPPKNLTWQKPSDDDVQKWATWARGSKEYKKLLLKALAVYHPDKVDENVHGKKWKVLCEEITKMITFHYESTKFLPD